jgi:hypothetical protein
MTISMQASPTAIDLGLYADYLPILAIPVPRELKDLIAQLVAFESRNRGSSARPVEVLESVMSQLALQPQSTGCQSRD